MATQSERYAEIAAKLGGTLTQLAVPAPPESGSNAIGATLGFFDSTALNIINGKVVIDAASIDGDIEGLLADLQAHGLEGGATWGNMVSGLLPIASLEAISALENLNFARGAQALSNIGSVENEADVAQRADEIRASDGLDGTGITIGIMSDSYNNLNGEADDIASGDLPNDVTVLLDLDTGTNGIDEGRAMAQLVHDIVPNADLLFRTAFLGQADFANGIGELVAAGADVITDDIFYFAEPFFQDGVIAQAADQAVANGVAYYTSAGNSSDNSYEATFSSSGQTITYTNQNGVEVTGALHDFDTGAGVDTAQSITFQGGGSFSLGFQWDNPFSSVSAGSSGALEDYDILLTDNNGNIVNNLTSSSSIIGGDPVEIFQISNSGSTAFQLNLSITRTNQGPQTTDNFIKYVLYRSGGVAVNEFDTQSSTAVGHSNSAAAVSVGAAFFGQTPEFGVNPPALESFSSVGRTDILFDTAGNRLATPEQRVKPDLVGVDGSNNTFFGNDSGADADSNPNFFGTSAAAPNVAAVAAQLLQFDPTLTPAQINAALIATAIDMDDPRTAGFDVGVDEATGAGLIQAAAALEFLKQIISNIVGTEGADNLTGTPNDDEINSLGGDDVIDGLAGNDNINAGDGNDSVQGGAGNDRLLGGRGADTLAGGDGGDRIFGQSGADIINGGAGDDNLTGQSSGDTMSGGTGDDILDGGFGDDILDGGAGIDRMSGGTGNDTYTVDNAADIVIEAADAGEDTIRASIDFTLSANFERLILLEPGLIAIGNDVINTIEGSSGADIIDGGLAGDFLNGNDGDDLIRGGDDNERDRLIGGNGDDQLEGDGGDDRLFGNSGDDVLFGGLGDDHLIGQSNDDVLFGGAGNDLMDGGTNADFMQGGAGDDTYFVDDVGDRIFETSGEGADTVQSSISYTLALGLENLTLTAGGLTGKGNIGGNTLNGSDGDDDLDGGFGSDVLNGGGGDDVLNGGIGVRRDTLIGAAGDDQMDGGAGDDRIFGNGGNDQIDGGSGADFIYAQSGDDRMTGGSGADTFQFRTDDGTDVISDFTANEDVFLAFAFGFASGADVLALAAQSGADTIVNLTGTGIVTLTGVTLADLDANDFAVA